VNRKRSLRVFGALAAAGLIVGACGGDDGDSDDTEAPAATTGAATDAPGETSSPDTTGGDAGGDAGEDAETIRLWLNGTDTPDALVEYAIAEYAKIHPNVKVELERQQWTGLVEKLTTSLSGSDAPDIVEFGNTQAQTFEAAGAVIDLTDRADELGGDDFLQSLLEASTYDGSLYAAPYYAGARIVVYRTDLFEQSGIEIPTTLDEFLAAGVKLKADNAATPNFSGIYLPGKNWYAVMSFVWDKGGDIATKDGDQWVGQLDSPESIAGLEYFKEVFDQANSAPADGDDANDYLAFCAGEVGMMPAPGWKIGQILNEEDGCPDMEGKIGAFALPGSEAGTTAPVFLGGSVLGIPSNSEHQDLAFDLLKVLVSPGYQAQFAGAGVIPALKSELDAVSGDDAAVAQATAAENSRFVPTSEHWAAVEAANVLPDMLVEIAQGGDIAEAAGRADSAIEAALNG
jgi:N,N'-diacetylchitobiose transport system substrate-binding protein